MDLDIRNTPRVAGPPGPPQIEIKQAHSHPHSTAIDLAQLGEVSPTTGGRRTSSPKISRIDQAKMPGFHEPPPPHLELIAWGYKHNHIQVGWDGTRRSLVLDSIGRQYTSLFSNL